MIGTIKKLFGIGPKVNYTELLQQGGIIIDVRTKSEYASGAIGKSINIPLDQLKNNLGKLKDKKMFQS